MLLQPNLHSSSIKALFFLHPQVTAAGVLLQRGLYFSAIKAVFSSPAAIRAVLEETRKTLEMHAREGADGDAPGLAWHW